MAIGDEQGSESPQALESLVAVLLGSLCVDGSTRRADGLGIELLRLPDEVLEEIALILGQEEMLCLRDYVPNIGDQDLALIGQLCRRVGEGSRGEEAVEGDIDLLVLQQGSCQTLHMTPRSWASSAQHAWVLTEGTLPCWKALMMP